MFADPGTYVTLFWQKFLAVVVTKILYSTGSLPLQAMTRLNTVTLNTPWPLTF